MSKISEIFTYGFTIDKKRLYAPGTLYELKSKLNDRSDFKTKLQNVETILDPLDAGTAIYAGNQQRSGASRKRAPFTYALEIHAINDKLLDGLDGYGTYIFIPDERKDTGISMMSNVYSHPSEFYDDEDPLKILASIYADSEGTSTNKYLTILELTLRAEEYYPIKNAIANATSKYDLLDDVYGIFEQLEDDQFCGISLVLAPTYQQWKDKANMRLRALEDMAYSDNTSVASRIGRFFRGEAQPEQALKEVGNYKKDDKDPQKMAQASAIREKIDSPHCFNCTLRIYASNPELAHRIADVLTTGSARKISDNTNDNRPGVVQGLRVFRENARGSLQALALRKEGERPFVLSSQEIATIWHVPDSSEYSDVNLKRIHKPLPDATIPPPTLVSIQPQGPGDVRYMLMNLSSQ